MEKDSLKGKRAVVCGASKGIGRASAFELARRGASVTLVARSEQELEKTASELPTPEGKSHHWFSADFAVPDELKKKIEADIAEYGPVEILVNNTGGPPPGPVSEAIPEDFLDAFTKHLICNHVMMQSVLPGMKKQGFGRIVNIISTSVKQPIPGLGVSNTIRGAVGNWSKTLSGEVAQFGITVNNVLPGATLTGRLKSLHAKKAEKTGRSVEDLQEEMKGEIPAGRFASPEEIAAAVGFLASPAASYVNGVNLPVDGGRTFAI